MAELHTPPRRRAAPVLLVACALSGSGAEVQSTAQSPARAFEVASVKPTLSPAEAGAAAGRAAALGDAPPPVPSYGIRTYPGGRLTAGATLRTLIARAYGVDEYQIADGPGWLGEDYFAIEARAGGDATPAEFNEMLQALLAERFALRVHRATRPGQVHRLVAARSDGSLGPSLGPTSPECVAQIEERERTRSTTPPAAPPPPAGSLPRGQPDTTARCGTVLIRGGSSGAMTLSASGQPLSILVDRLKSELSASVVDRTGLEGRFDFEVEFEAQRPVIPGFGRGGLDPNSTESPRLPLRIAIERQLGLRLESIDGEVPVLVVDAAERPTPN